MTLRQFSKLTGYPLKETAALVARATGHTGLYAYRYYKDREIADIPGGQGVATELLLQRIEDCQAVLADQTLVEGIDLQLVTFVGLDGSRGSSVRLRGKVIGFLSWPANVQFPLNITDCCLSLARNPENEVEN